VATCRVPGDRYDEQRNPEQQPYASSATPFAFAEDHDPNLLDVPGNLG
jgi:hypothetical protein